MRLIDWLILVEGALLLIGQTKISDPSVTESPHGLRAEIGWVWVRWSVDKVQTIKKKAFTSSLLSLRGLRGEGRFSNPQPCPTLTEVLIRFQFNTLSVVSIINFVISAASPNNRR
jgi:hypothetical protein